jgi:hypothetical protein
MNKKMPKVGNPNFLFAPNIAQSERETSKSVPSLDRNCNNGQKINSQNIQERYQHMFKVTNLILSTQSTPPLNAYCDPNRAYGTVATECQAKQSRC